jgi:DNA-binding CsgD family transcriptional regulator
LIDELTTITFHRHLRLPSTWWLLGKTAVMLEGLGLRLDPDFDIFAVVAPYVKRLMKQLALPDAGLGRTLLLDSVSWRDLAHRLPRIRHRIAEHLEQNEPFHMEIKDNDRILSRLDQLATRLSLSVLVAASIIGMPVLLPLTAPGSLPISLSAREMEVLALIAEGKSNQEISTELYLALNTVKRHAYNIFTKLEVKKRTQAVSRARQLGLIP